MVGAARPPDRGTGRSFSGVGLVYGRVPRGWGQPEALGRRPVSGACPGRGAPSNAGPIGVAGGLALCDSVDTAPQAGIMRPLQIQ